MLNQFLQSARTLSRNPLGILALFITLVYGFACLVVSTGVSLTFYERIPIVYFIITFPFAILGVFTYLVSFRSAQLFSPADFKKEEHYVELQKMALSAVASLTAAKSIKDRSDAQSTNISEIVKSVESALSMSKSVNAIPNLLWVDDNPENNVYERNAFEAIGIKISLSETTLGALELMKNHKFDAIISDMGRREGPREGYVLLDALRAGGDMTPLYFYASSAAPEHVRETLQHGGQGCTNDGQHLFNMVAKKLFEQSRMP